MTEEPPVRRKYERVGQLLIRPLMMREGQSAYDLARLFYAQYSDLDFDADFEDYLRNGYIAVRPNLFAMVRPIEHEGRRGWFCRIAIGNLGELITTWPCRLDFIAFCRNNNPDSMVIVDYDVFLKKVGQLNGYKEGNGEV
jgi:hypothetical protein